MQGGKLSKRITIQSLAYAVDDFGTATGELAEPTGSFVHEVEVRAQVVQLTAQEFLRTGGASSETTIIFRIRFLDGVTLAERVMYKGEAYRIVELKEIGRRQILELRCARVGL